MKSKTEIISAGNLNIDFIGKLERLPKPGEKTLLDGFSRRPGGGGANFAVACAKLGLNSAFVGCVGGDSFGKEALLDLEENGVDTSCVKEVKASTGLAFIFLTPQNDRLLIEHRGANSYLESSDLKEDYLVEGELLHASSLTPEMTVAAGRKGKELDLKTSLDLGAELTAIGRKRLSDILEHFDICFMNGETFESLFKITPSKQSVLERFPRGLEAFIVTLGPGGAIATDGSEVVSSPSYDVEVSDTTGAGDAFAAAFDKFCLEGAGLEDSIKYATAEAAIKIQHVGAREGLPSQEELERFVEDWGRS